METVTIHLAPEDEQHEDQILDLMAELMIRDPNFSGVDIDIESGDFTCVVDDDEIRGACLLSSVFGVINAERS